MERDSGDGKEGRAGQLTGAASESVESVLPDTLFVLLSSMTRGRSASIVGTSSVLCALGPAAAAQFGPESYIPVS